MLKSHKPKAINNLKYFLTVVPSSEKIKHILITAINQLIETEPETIYWLSKNPSSLQPEIDIKVIVAQKLNEKLIAWEFKPEDIHFNEHGNLEFNTVAKDRLLSGNPSLDNCTEFKLIQLFLTELI
ncbi:MAG: hypothetical protein NWQ43_07585 [Dolichospermum sp.]|nr:hypothetical protein [Dolichospermum sp.]